MRQSERRRQDTFGRKYIILGSEAILEVVIDIEFSCQKHCISE